MADRPPSPPHLDLASLHRGPLVTGHAAVVPSPARIPPRDDLRATLGVDAAARPPATDYPAHPRSAEATGASSGNDVFTASQDSGPLPTPARLDNRPISVPTSRETP